MDKYDIFKQLTCGTRFNTKKKISDSNFENKLASSLKTEEFNEADYKSIIKTESEVDVNEQSCYSSGCDDSSDYNPNLKIKDEVKSEDEENGYHESSFSLFSNSESSSSKIPKIKKEMDEHKLKKLSIEKNNQIRNINNIHASGKNPPKPIENFEELKNLHNVSSHLIDNLTKCGYSIPTPIQMQTIPCMLLGRPLIACAPTGSGKTAAFLIPIIRDLKRPQKKGFRALILCPTRELAKQTQRECIRLSEGINFRIHIISKINQADMKYGKNSSKQYDILITTPKRVCFLLDQDPPILDLSNIQWLILDEADKLFESSANSFREQFNQIFNACTSTKKKVALFSATHTSPVAKWGQQNLKGMLSITVGQRNTATDLVDQELLFVGSESGKLLAFRDLVRKGLKPPVLVFVQSKDRAHQLFNELLYDGINVDVIHADRTQQQRDNVVKAFREGKIWILICTELMGRGIDFKGVNLVINYDFPPSTISYIHRIGRTGRAGRRGKAITFFTQNDTINLRGIANIMRNSGCEVPEYMLAMKKLTKRDRRKMEKNAPERDAISTKLKFKNKRKSHFKLNKLKTDGNEKNENGVIKTLRKRKKSNLLEGNLKKRKTET